MRSLEWERLRLRNRVAFLLGKQRQMSASPLVLSRFIAHKIGRHGEEPRSFAGDGVLPESAQESLLCDLLGPVAIPEPPGQVPDQRRVVLTKESFQQDVVHVVTSSSRGRPPRCRR